MRKLPDPPRWRKTRGASTLDSHLGEVFAQATPSGELSSAENARILRSLQAQNHPPRKPLRVWVPVFGALIALFVGSYAVATGRLDIWLGDKPAKHHAQSLVTRPLQDSPAKGKFLTEEPRPQAGLIEEPPTEVPQPLAVAKHRRVVTRQPPARVDERDSEVALLGAAFRALQVQGDAAAALTALDLYAARHPKGTLAPEAIATRINALVRLNRIDDALSLLNSWQPQHVHERAWATTRGELRARQSACSDAVQDFDIVLAPSNTDVFTERALQGRSYCRFKLGDVSGARQDLEKYLQLFPHGRFIEQTTKSLRSHL